MNFDKALDNFNKALDNFDKALDNQNIDEMVKNITSLYPVIDQNFLKWLTECGYFVVPASLNHHGCFENGLYLHSKETAEQLIRLTQNNNLTWSRIDSPAIIGLFHDICKIEEYIHPQVNITSFGHEKEKLIDVNKWIKNPDILFSGHGEKSVMILASHLQLTEEEVMCIRYHMGAFTDKSEWDLYTRAIKKYPNILFAHMADMISSQVKGI